MSKLFAVLVLLAVVGSAVASVQDADVETDIPTTRPRKGKALSKARTIGRGYGGQKVITVPKGDPRAQGPAPVPKPARKLRDQRVIVEAEDTAAGSATVAVAAAGGPVARPVLKAGAPAANPGACLASYNGATVATKAAAYQTNYKSRGVKYSQPNRQFGITAKFSDCSSFVTSILADTGFNCLFAAGRNTAYMNQMIRARGGYNAKTAKLGDIVMWGSHTGIVVKVCSATTFSMVAMGNSGAGRAECKTPAQLASGGWGSGGFLGFWTPRP